MWEFLVAAQKLIATRFCTVNADSVNNGEKAGNQMFTNFPEII